MGVKGEGVGVRGGEGVGVRGRSKGGRSWCEGWE